MAKHWLVIEGDGLPAPFRTRPAGAGRHLPTAHLTTDELMATTRHNMHIDLERLTGIRERRVSIGDEDSYSLATSAALDFLGRANQRAAELDVVISCSITKFRGGLTPAASTGQMSPTTARTFVPQSDSRTREMCFD
jgi:3-oxoacyl-[acyl-carrier-protein] synthase III